MKQYIFIDFDRYEAANSKQYQFEHAGNLREAFKYALKKYIGMTDEDFDEDVEGEFVTKGKMIILDVEEFTHILIEVK